MKRYVKATKMTTEEIAEKLRTKYELFGYYTTRRGKEYKYRIMRDGWVEVWWDKRIYDGVSRQHDKSIYLYKVPMELQNYLTDQYSEQLAELGITLHF